MLNKKDKWSALSMKERADLIKLYVSNGVTSLNDIKKDYNSFAPGGHLETDEYGYPADITPAVITQDPEFNKFLMTLPDNQRLTPEEDYHTYLSWKLNGKPKTFQEAVDNDLMYSWDETDNSYHGYSVAYDESTDTYYGLKPLHHPTASLDYDTWYQKGIHTLPGGKQVPLEGEDRKEWEDFRKNYNLVFEGNDYKYVPRKPYNSFAVGGNLYNKKPDRTQSPNGTGRYPIYGSYEKAKFAYDAGSRNPEAISALFDDYAPNRAIGKSYSYTSRINGAEYDNFQSYFKTTGNNNLGIEQRLGRVNGKETDVTTFFLPNGDTYSENHIDETDQYNVDYAKRLGIDKLPKPKILFENGGKLLTKRKYI